MLWRQFHMQSKPYKRSSMPVSRELTRFGKPSTLRSSTVLRMVQILEVLQRIAGIFHLPFCVIKIWIRRIWVCRYANTPTLVECDGRTQMRRIHKHFRRAWRITARCRKMRGPTQHLAQRCCAMFLLRLDLSHSHTAHQACGDQPDLSLCSHQFSLRAPCSTL